MAVFSLIGGLFGCQKAQAPAKHELSEVTSISISCGNMDRSCGYSFWVHMGDDGWLFDTECFTHDREVETVLKDRVIGDEDARALLEILERCNSVAHVENYKKPKGSLFFVADEETYGFCLSFSDGSRYVTYDRQSELEEFFYRLAEKYAE